MSEVFPLLRLTNLATMQDPFTEASFNEFCARPEQRKAVEEEHNKQLSQQLKLQQQQEAVAFRDQVIAMLRQALHLLQNGRITEQELEHALLTQLEVGANRPGYVDASTNINQTCSRQLTSAELVAVLNHHLTLRRQGNEHYKLKQFTEALANYNSAKCLLEKAKASQGESQEEVICNLVATELNIAAVHISEQHYGAAIKSCTSALSVDGKNTKALMRRAKAHKGRHNLEDAANDLSKVVSLDPANLEAHALLHKVRDDIHNATKYSGVGEL